MGAAQTTSASASERTLQPVTEVEQTQWRRNQSGSRMIQKLSTDVEAQYQCYQPYLLLKDIMHLRQTCRIWSDWIRSPSSVIHRSPGHLRNRSCVVTVRNSNELFRVTRSPWIGDYLYGCRVRPSIDDQSNSWVSDSIFNIRLKRPPPLLTQLAELKQIQYLTLDYVRAKEITTERIQTYFTALAPSLRSLDLFPVPFDELFSTDPTGTSTNNFLTQIHLLTHLEELHVSAHLGSLFLNQLPHLSRFHTFICRPPHASQGEYRVPPALYGLANCKRLKHCSFGRSVGAKGVKEFILARQKSRHTNVSSSEVCGGGGGDCDEIEEPMEFLDLSGVWMDHDLWTMIVANFPKLQTLEPDWQLLPHDWSSLRIFKQLTHLSIIRYHHHALIEIDYFWNDLIQCRTIESLTLGNMKTLISESRIRSILSHLPALTELTLSNMRIENLAGFSEPNRLRRLAFKRCICNFNIGTTLPSIPSLTHRLFRLLTALEQAWRPITYCVKDEARGPWVWVWFMNDPHFISRMTAIATTHVHPTSIPPLGGPNPDRPLLICVLSITFPFSTRTRPTHGARA